VLQNWYPPCWCTSLLVARQVEWSCLLSNLVALGGPKPLGLPHLALGSAPHAPHGPHPPHLVVRLTWPPPHPLPPGVPQWLRHVGPPTGVVVVGGLAPTLVALHPRQEAWGDPQAPSAYKGPCWPCACPNALGARAWPALQCGCRGVSQLGSATQHLARCPRGLLSCPYPPLLAKGGHWYVGVGLPRVGVAFARVGQLAAVALLLAGPGPGRVWAPSAAPCCSYSWLCQSRPAPPGHSIPATPLHTTPDHPTLHHTTPRSAVRLGNDSYTFSLSNIGLIPCRDEIMK